MCNKYLLMEGDISRWKKVKLDLSDWKVNLDKTDDFISECDQNVQLVNMTDDEYSDYLKTVISEEEYQEIMIDISKDDFISKCNSKDETFNVSEEQSQQLCDFKKPLYYKCEKCGNPMYPNMKFGVVELECETCGNYTEI